MTVERFGCPSKNVKHAYIVNQYHLSSLTFSKKKPQTIYQSVYLGAIKKKKTIYEKVITLP